MCTIEGMADDEDRDDKPGNVIQLRRPVVLEEPRRTLRRSGTRFSGPGRPFCMHRHYMVAMHEAIVECADCGAPLDVWTVVRSLTNDHERTWSALDMADDERGRLLAEIEILKRERKKLGRGLPREVVSRARIEAMMAPRVRRTLALVPDPQGEDN
jgi:hypothetical protein